VCDNDNLEVFVKMMKMTVDTFLSMCQCCDKINIMLSLQSVTFL